MEARDPDDPEAAPPRVAARTVRLDRQPSHQTTAAISFSTAPEVDGDDLDYDLDSERQNQQQVQKGSRNRWWTPRTILGMISLALAITIFGLGIKMVVRFGDQGLVHVSIVFIGFTTGAPIAWQLVEFITRCARRNGTGIYPGAHVGVGITICLACVATMGYLSIWVSDGSHHWKHIPTVNDIPALEHSPLYRFGIILLVLLAALLLVNFILSILACQEIRRKDDAGQRAMVTVRYDGVGPVGTARPREYEMPVSINLEAYQARYHLHDHRHSSAAPIVIARGDLGVEIVETDHPGPASPRPPEAIEKGQAARQQVRINNY